VPCVHLAYDTVGIRAVVISIMNKCFIKGVDFLNWWANIVLSRTMLRRVCLALGL
jgi:hypothetical protein